VAGTGAGRWSTRWPRRTLPALAAGLALASRPAAPRLDAQPSAPVAVAGALDAAWNAHDLGAVLAVFAPDAVVRERRGDVPAAVWDTRDPHVVRAYLEGSHDGDNYDTGGLVWVTGHQQIAAWAAARFAQHHRFESARPREAGDLVVWQYREFVDPFQRTPGVAPIEGSAEAVVRSDRITSLTLVLSPASAHRQRSEVAAAFDHAMATQRRAPPSDGPTVMTRRPPSEGASAEPIDSAWVLALGALALVGAGAVARRRRRGSRR
jgi:hypothetical protein